MAKISEYTSVTSLTGTEELPVVQSAATKKATVKDLLGYKVYTALVKYNTLTDEFEQHVFRDDFDDFFFTRISAGQYNINSALANFENNKTQIFISQDNNTGGGADGEFVFNVAFRENASNIRIDTNDVDITNGTNTPVDAMSGLSIEIRVYP